MENGYLGGADSVAGSLSSTFETVLLAEKP
ncbi:hypothetical protein JS278_02609 [Acidipropionibacterium virtanenii]|uniref:Uncharacterized protein n=1 Tax=Acidipropionibacterium virtanenii TaxID=2057246 RepID=A0A344UWU9_9ACTN|nr:hypothetical protein JS278_02609 [Acidipropionibacterium virtanenii]